MGYNLYKCLSSITFSLFGFVNHHVPDIVFRYIIVINNHYIANHFVIIVNTKRLTLVSIDICLCRFFTEGKGTGISLTNGITGECTFWTFPLRRPPGPCRKTPSHISHKSLYGR